MTELGAEWDRILPAAASALDNDRRTFSITDPDTAERHLLSRMTGQFRKDGTKTVRVRTSQFETHVRSVFGRSGDEFIAEALGRVVGAAKAARRERDDRVRALLAEVSSSPLADTEWFTAWLEQLRSNGILTRLAHGEQSLSPVVRLLEDVPVDEMPLPVAGERYFGDTKALSLGGQRGLLLRALAWRYRLDVPATTAAERDLLEQAGIIADDLASQVLVLNLPMRGDPIAGWLATAAAIPFRLTLQQLRSAPAAVTADTVFVVENPSVLRAAAGELGAACPPMVCSEGVPSAALYRLLDAAPGTRIRWRADFDWAGIGIVRRGLERYPHASPWRMSAGDYARGTDSDGIALRGKPLDTAWDTELGPAMTAAGRAVMEEAMLPLLLDDLRSSSQQCHLSPGG